MIPSLSTFKPLSLLCVLTLLVTAGCGGKAKQKPGGSVSVTVTFDGKPITEGRVNLQNKTGEGGGGELNSSGTINMPHVAEGTYSVTITPPIIPIAPPEPGKTLPPPKEYPNIPEKFRQTESSPLKAEVQKKKNEFKFDLKQ